VLYYELVVLENGDAMELLTVQSENRVVGVGVLSSVFPES